MLRIVLIYVISVFISVSCDVGPPISLNPTAASETYLGKCQSCKLFIKSFENGLERTARGKFEGGDAAWEEEKLTKTYRRSEMRLIDIQESLCKEQSKYSVHCHHVAEKAEEFIEEWWAQDLDESVDLFKFICVEKLQVCCPKGHYGKDCKPCPSDCNNNGVCRGEGTRKGNGTCLCHQGYSGEFCDICSSGYFKSKESESECLPCHPSCVDCRDGNGSPKDCVACKPGFIYDTEGCRDVNECEDINACRKDQFCMNSLGSYKCEACDKSCDSCHGDGPDMCRKCAAGYSKKGEFCIHDRADENNLEELANTRYMTYVGLLIATGILLPKSASLGSFVGFLSFAYIIGAEYYCMINGHRGLVDLKHFDLMTLFKI